MKHTKKRAVKFLLAAFALISAFGAAMTANAAAPKLSTGKVTTYVGGVTEVTIKGVKTQDFIDNKVSIEAEGFNYSVASVYGGPGAKMTSNCVVSILGNKKGKTKATITVRYGDNLEQKKDLKLNVTVNKYTNPCASLKIGKKNYASKFKKKTYTDITLPKKSAKISVKPKKGWKLSRIFSLKFLGPANTKVVKIKNNKKLDKSKLQSAIFVEFQNIKTKCKMTINLGAKDGQW